MKVRERSRFGQKRTRLGGEDLGFCCGRVELEAPLRYSGGDDRKVTTGFSNVESLASLRNADSLKQ